MAFNIGSDRTLTYLSKAFVTTIQHPQEMNNQFTIKNEALAEKTLSEAGFTRIQALKAYVRQLDMTSISTKELAELGSKLYEYGLISEGIVGHFIDGRGDSDASGQSTNRDVKFNAIALFNQKYEGYLKVMKDLPGVVGQDCFKSVGPSIVGANHVLSALSFFASSSQSDISINDRA